MQLAEGGSSWRVSQPDTADFVARVFLRASWAMLTAAGVATMVAYSPRLWTVLYSSSGPTITGWATILAPLPLACWFGRVVETMSLAVARLALFVWSIAIGASLASVLHVYAGAEIQTALLGTAAGFAVLTMVVMSAHSKLNRVGAFATVGVVGLLVAMLLNLLLRSPALDFASAALGVIVFSALAAFDMQRIERLYEGGLGSAEANERLAMVGALTLSLDFLNLLLSVLRLASRRR